MNFDHVFLSVGVEFHELLGALLAIFCQSHDSKEKAINGIVKQFVLCFSAMLVASIAYLVKSSVVFHKEGPTLFFVICVYKILEIFKKYVVFLFMRLSELISEIWKDSMNKVVQALLDIFWSAAVYTNDFLQFIVNWFPKLFHAFFEYSETASSENRTWLCYSFLLFFYLDFCLHLHLVLIRQI